MQYLSPPAIATAGDSEASHFGGRWVAASFVNTTGNWFATRGFRTANPVLRAADGTPTAALDGLKLPVKPTLSAVQLFSD